jgi:hypothetical protein
MVTNKNTAVVQSYGQADDIYTLAKRIKVMVPGGNKLNDSEAQALAQVSLVTQCNPFIGEIWYIPSRGPMIGIKGARRHGNQQILEAGGKEAYWFPDLKPCTGEEAGYKGDIKGLEAAYKCTITDSVSSRAYQQMFLETVNSLRAAGSKDPVGEAREICGKRPEWNGYGFSTVAEQSKMNKQALAMKRAEADALKRKFDIPFGAEVASGDTALEAEASDWVETPPTNMSDTVDQTFKPADVLDEGDNDEAAPIEIVPVMGDWAVSEAAKFWNLDKVTAAKNIAKKWHGNMDKREFLDLLHQTA